MLKKLVKYGNSNALVLDKAILELLDIAEGSVLKISTDGKSIILTPQKKMESQKIHETYNTDQAWLDLSFPSESTRKELSQLYKSYQDLFIALSKDPTYLQELAQLRQHYSENSVEFIEAYNALRNRLSPELMEIEKKLTSFGVFDEKEKTSLQQEFAAVFKKYPTASIAYNSFLNNPEYQHEAQLAAERYKENKNSASYMEAIDKLQNKYSPETEALRQELKAITKKYHPPQEPA